MERAREETNEWSWRRTEANKTTRNGDETNTQNGDETNMTMIRRNDCGTLRTKRPKNKKNEPKTYTRTTPSLPHPPFPHPPPPGHLPPPPSQWPLCPASGCAPAAGGRTLHGCAAPEWVAARGEPRPDWQTCHTLTHSPVSRQGRTCLYSVP